MLFFMLFLGFFVVFFLFFLVFFMVFLVFFMVFARFTLSRSSMFAPGFMLFRHDGAFAVCFLCQC